MLKFKKLFHKLLASFLVLSIPPLIVLLWISLQSASSSLEKIAIDKIEAVRSLKLQQIDSFFSALENELSLVKSDSQISQSLSELVDAYASTNSTDSAQWLALKQHIQPVADAVISATGWYDMFFISPDGHIVYSQAGESDVGMSLINDLSESSFGKIFSKAKNAGQIDFMLSDFQPYSPSNGKPAAFMLTSISQNEMLQGYLALQIPLERINQIMQQREGMGETGESYLVGTDKRMRSDSFLDPNNRTVERSFAGNLANNGIDTEAVEAALSNTTDTRTLTDYNGNKVLSAFAPFSYGDIQWALIVEIDEAEALQAVNELWEKGIIALVVTMIIVVLLGTIIAKNASKTVDNIGRIARIADGIANGDLTQDIEVTQNDEVGKLEGSMRTMVEKLRSMIDGISGAAETLSAAAEEMSNTTNQISSTINNQQVATDSVASAVTQMTASIEDVSRNTNNAAEAAQNTSKKMLQSKQEVSGVVVEVSNMEGQLKNTVELIEELKSEATEISGILDVIKGIADQTNLLALNAAIEAARAGEQGRGFAVVADEVRTLAMNTQQSTGKIEDMIKKLQAGSTNSVEAMQAGVQQTELIVGNVNETAEVIKNSQSAMQEIEQMSIQIASAIHQQLEASNEISQNTNEISLLNNDSVSCASDISQASQDLARLSNELVTMVGQFNTRH